MDKKRRAEKVKKKSLDKKSAKKRDPLPTNPRHREDFELLLDDAVSGVATKK